MVAHLIYYRTEKERLKDTKYSQQITLLEAVGIVYFLSKKYKLRQPNILFRDRQCSSFRHPNTLSFTTKYLTSGTVTHEFVHYLQFVKTGKTRHDNKMFRIVKKVQRYVDTLI
jgi:hypothetical protein